MNIPLTDQINPSKNIVLSLRWETKHGLGESLKVTSISQRSDKSEQCGLIIISNMALHLATQVFPEMAIGLAFLSVCHLSFKYPKKTHFYPKKVK